MAHVTEHLGSTCLRLRADGSTERLPVTPAFWPDLIAGRLGDFHHEYLVSCHRFDADWINRENHPVGDEVVVLLDGAVDFILEGPAGNTVVALRKAGDFALVPRNTWHTANVIAPATVLFITAGEGTQGKPR